MKIVAPSNSKKGKTSMFLFISHQVSMWGKQLKKPLTKYSLRSNKNNESELGRKSKLSLVKWKKSGGNEQQ